MFVTTRCNKVNVIHEQVFKAVHLEIKNAICEHPIIVSTLVLIVFNSFKSFHCLSTSFLLTPFSVNLTNRPIFVYTDMRCINYNYVTVSLATVLEVGPAGFTTEWKSTDACNGFRWAPSFDEALSNVFTLDLLIYVILTDGVCENRISIMEAELL